MATLRKEALLSAPEALELANGRHARPNGARRTPARPSFRHAHHLFAQSFHSADASVPGQLPLLHLCQAAAQK